MLRQLFANVLSSRSFIRHLLLIAITWLPTAVPLMAGPGYRVSYLQRIRIETTNNATTLNDDALAGSSYLRNRTSLMFQVMPNNRWELAVKLTNEMRNYFVQETRPVEWDEIFFDQLYAKWDSIGGAPLSITVGRQNISYGEGFVVMDGGPLDGSRSGYFNAVNADWGFAAKSRLAITYLLQPKVDQYLPLIHDQHKSLIEQPQEGFILYYTGAVKTCDLQGYLIRKNDFAVGTAPSGHVNCLGSYIKAPLTPNLKMTGELAVQSGDRADKTRKAFGGYAYATYNTGWPIYFPKNFTIGGLYLSGDKANTSAYEGWDPLFARWPKWSDLYIYTQVRETGVAYWTNLASLFVKTSVDLTPDFALSVDYHHLMAPQPSDSASAFPGGGGRTRGDLFIGKLAYQMNKHLSGHVLIENLQPGNFYFAGAQDCVWMRTELLLKF